MTVEPGRTRSAAARMADPVPSPVTCSTHSAPSGRPSSTPSPGRVMQSTRSAPASRAAPTTQWSIGSPQSGWSTLGRDERIRVPRPAAITRTVSDSAIGGRLPAGWARDGPYPQAVPGGSSSW